MAEAGEGECSSSEAAGDGARSAASSSASSSSSSSSSGRGDDGSGCGEACEGAIEAEGPLVPGLPDDLALECILARVSWQQLTSLSSVSRSWRAAIQSRAVFDARARVGVSEKLVVVLHKVRALKSVCVRLSAAGGPPPPPPVRPRLASSRISADDDSDTFAYGLSLHDPADDSWLQLPSIASVGCGVPLFSELACFRGRLFVLGGRDHETWQPRREVFMLDLVAGRGVWRRCASMLTPRASFGCGVIGDKLYVAGGHSEASCALANAEVYDPAADTWERIADMSGARSCCTVAIRDEKMYVIGGYTIPGGGGGGGGGGEGDAMAGGDDEDGDDERARLLVDSDDEDGDWADSAEVLDASTGQWTQLQNVKQFNDYDEQACTVFRGELYSFSTLGVEKFDLESNTWTEMYKDSWYMGHRKAWCFAYGDGSTPCLVLAVAPVDNEVFAMVCMGDECDRGCTLLKSKNFGKPGPKLAWEKTVCPVNFVCAFPALCAIEV